jgi:hypothetical protein
MYPAMTNRQELSGAVLDEFEALYSKLKAFLQTAHDADGNLILQIVPGTTSTNLGLPIGVTLPYAGTTAPPGFLLCDGSAVSRTTYAALFSIIGIRSGAGDGSTTFNVPDARGRAIYGMGTGVTATLGGTFGALSHVHAGPSHSHSIAAPSSIHTHGATTGAAGAGNTGGSNPPGLVQNYLIVSGV